MSPLWLKHIFLSFLRWHGGLWHLLFVLDYVGGIWLGWVYLLEALYHRQLWSIAEAVSSSSRPILFPVLKLNVAICIVLLHFSNFCFNLSYVDGFWDNWGRALNPAGCVPFFTRTKSNAVWTGGLSVGYGNLLMAVFFFIFINRSHRKRWVAIVLRSSYLILAVVLWDSSAQHLVSLAVDASLGSFVFSSTTLLLMASKVYKKKETFPASSYIKF